MSGSDSSIFGAPAPVELRTGGHECHPIGIGHGIGVEPDILNDYFDDFWRELWMFIVVNCGR